MESMKLVVQIQLIPNTDQSSRLKATMERVNEACNWIAGECFDRKCANHFEARKFAYRETREKFGLSSQQTQLAINAVCFAYKRDKAIRVHFRKDAAIDYDPRTMSFKGIDRVSLLTLDGRIVVPFILGKYQADRMPMAKGQCKLILRGDGKWFLIVTIDVPDVAPIPVTDFIGVDLGVTNIATDSDANAYTGAIVEKVRHRHRAQRRRLQKKGTKGAKKKLKRIGMKESRFRRHENHCISKSIVANAKGTGRGIAVEELTGISDRITARGGDGRHRLKGWAFSQLRAFIEYKARLEGIPVIAVDPRNTSRTCSTCGHCEKANRKTQSEFSCVSCSMGMNADQNAALNIRVRALGSLKQPTGLAGTLSA
jgi:putative transposase